MLDGNGAQRAHKTPQSPCLCGLLYPFLGTIFSPFSSRTEEKSRKQRAQKGAFSGKMAVPRTERAQKGRTVFAHTTMPKAKKHPSGYRIQIKVNGNRDSATFPTMRECNEWATKRTLELKAQAKGAMGQLRTTHDAFNKYAEEISPDHKGERWEVIRLEKMQREFPKVLMSKLDSTHVVKWRDERLKEVAKASVLREMKLLNSVFEQARKEWKWLLVNPVIDVAKPQAPPHRNRTIQPIEVRKMLRALGYPKRTLPRHAVAHAFLLALITGMRQGELAGITWANVKPDYIHLPNTKGIGDHARSRDVPLSPMARKVVEMMRGYHDTSVFNIGAGSIDTHFRNARGRAGLSGFTFHDTRHTAATRIGMSGKLTLPQMCAMFGWSDPKMAMIYFNPSASDIAAKL